VFIVDERSVGPEPAAKILTLHDVTGTIEEHPQELERLSLQHDRPIAHAQFARAGIERECVEPADRRRCSGAASCSESDDSCRLRLERFCEIEHRHKQLRETSSGDEFHQASSPE
jgi:hypothetical protein